MAAEVESAERSAPREGAARLPSVTALALLALPLLLLFDGLRPGRTIVPSLPAAQAPWRSADPRAEPARAEPPPPWPLLDAWTIHAAVRSGSLPTWNPWSELGLPLAASASLGAFHPPNLLLWLVAPERARAWLALATLLVAGLGSFLWLAREGLSRGAALCGALAAQASPFALQGLSSGEAALDAFAWLPFALFALASLARAERGSGAARGAGLVLALAIALACTAGAWLASAAILATSLLLRPRAWPWLALGLAGGAIELVPRLETVLVWGPLPDHASAHGWPARLGGGLPLALALPALVAGVRARGARVGSVGAALVLAGLALERLVSPAALGLAWIGWAAILAAGVEALARRTGSIAAWTVGLALALVALFGGEGPRARALPAVTQAALPTEGFRSSLALIAREGRVLVLDEKARELCAPGLLPALGITELGAPGARRDPALARVLEGLAQAAAPFGDGARAPLASPYALDHPLLDLLDVRAALAGVPRAHRRLELAARGEGVHALLRGGALGAARLVPRLQRVDDERALERMVLEASLDARLVALATPASLAKHGEPDAPPAGAPRTLRVERPAAHRVEALVEGEAGGWIVFAGSPYPGWKASVNGEDAPVVRLDGLLRGVPLSEPARDGRVVVRTWFEPWSLRIGCAASAAALFVWLGLLRRASRASESCS